MTAWHDPAAGSTRHEQTWRAGLADGLDEDTRELLGAVASMARAATGAVAASVCTLDTEQHLVFQAVSGDGADLLIGTRFSAERGIAGWVAVTGEPMAVENPAADARFARDIAVRSGFIPSSILAVPVSHSGVVLGVLEVLDPAPAGRSSIADLDRLTDFAANIGTALYTAARSSMILREQLLATEDAELGALTGALGALVGGLAAEDRAAGVSLLSSLCAFLERRDQH